MLSDLLAGLAIGKGPVMQLELRRIILFTADMERMRRFYTEVIGLKPLPGAEPGWIELDTGTCRVALHAGKSECGSRPPKLGFFAADVANARAVLIGRGAKLGKVTSTRDFDMCGGKDPDGNPFGITSRK
jgi:catechol 2,3-dioxygenase-like lactoylglutathione lyase family enzyme